MIYKDFRAKNPARVQGKPIWVMRSIRIQVSQIRREGLTAVVRKAWIFLRLAPDLPGALMAIPIVAFVRLLSPFLKIRFGPIRSPN